MNSMKMDLKAISSDGIFDNTLCASGSVPSARLQLSEAKTKLSISIFLFSKSLSPRSFPNVLRIFGISFFLLVRSSSCCSA